jgi:predicted glycosyltransferase
MGGAVHVPISQAVPLIDDRLSLLFYCHDALRFGQTARAALLAKLSSHFRVVVVAGDQGRPMFALPPQVEVVHLRTRGPSSARAVRRKVLMDTYLRVDPAVVVIEQFPFGCHEMSDDIVGVLEAAAANPRTRLVACSVVEILVDLAAETPRPDDPVQRLADRYFDVVLVHADPRLGRLEETFEPHALRVPIRYTGFIAPAPAWEAARLVHSRKDVVVTCDSARPDGALFRAALAAYDHWAPSERLPLRIVAGPALPDRELAALKAEAARRLDVMVERNAEDLRVSADNVAVSVSDGACDTVFEMLRIGVPALVVAGGWGDDERGEWAHRLAALGVVRLVERDRLDGAALADEITATRMLPPPYLAINRSGAAETLHLVTKLADPARVFARSFLGIEAV